MNWKKSIISNCCASAVFATVACGQALAQDENSATTPTTNQKSGVISITQPIVAGKEFKTNDATWLEVMFTDGTSLVLAPNTSITVDSFEFNPDTGKHELNATLSSGMMRVLASQQSENSPVNVATPTGQVALRNGAALLNVSSTEGTSASFMWGSEMTLTSGNQTESVVRPGFKTVAMTAQQAPSNPRRLTSVEFQTNTESMAPAAGTVVASWSGTVEGQAAGPPPAMEAPAPPAPAHDSRPLLDPSLVQSDNAGQLPVVAVASLSSGSSTTTTTTTATTTTTTTTPAAAETEALPTLAFGDAFDAGSSPAGGELPDPSTSGSVAGNYATILKKTKMRMKRDPSGSSTLKYDSGNGVLKLRDDPYEDQTTATATKNKYDLSVNQVFWGTNSTVGGTPQNVGGVLFGVTDTYMPLGDAGLDVGVVVNLGCECQGLIADGVKTSSYFDFVITENIFSGATTIAAFNKPTLQEITKNTGAALGTVIGSRFGGKRGTDASITTVGDGNMSGKFLAITDPADVNFIAYDLTILGSGDGAGDRDRLFIIGGDQITGGTGSSSIPGTNDQFSVTKYAIASGLANLVTGSRLEASPLTGTAFTTNDGFRRNETFSASTRRGDTELLIASRPSTASSAKSVFLRADLHFINDGSSSISLATGEVAPLGASGDGSLALAGKVVGSVRSSATKGSTHIASAIGSLGTGKASTDAHLYGGNSITGTRIGYFGLTQDNPVTTVLTGTLEGASENTPATGNPTGTSVDYAFSRLAIGVGIDADATNPAVSDFTSRTSNTLNGFATGVVEHVDASGSTLSLYTLGVESSANITITTVPTTNQLTAAFQLAGKPPGGGTLPSNLPQQVNITFGGSAAADSGKSAFVTDSVFGARAESATVDNTTGTADLGMVTATPELITGIFPEQTIAAYSYVKWGFWFGDIVKNAQQRDRVHLGYWVAGKPTETDLLQSTGQATYTGHAIGTIVESATGIREKVGTFQNTWDFAARQGTVTMNFDSASYQGATNTMTVSPNYTGTITNVANRQLSLNGAFFGTAVAGKPPETAGKFSIKETSGTSYRADGIFAAKQQ